MTRNRAIYSGNFKSPAYDAAFVSRARSSLASSIAANASGRDGQFWKIVR